MHKKPGQSINEFLLEMSVLWDQLSLSKPNWHDPCDAILNAKEQDEFQVYQFIMTLNNEFKLV